MQQMRKSQRIFKESNCQIQMQAIQSERERDREWESDG